jgi:hypothetical protein
MLFGPVDALCSHAWGWPGEKTTHTTLRNLLDALDLAAPNLGKQGIPTAYSTADPSGRPAGGAASLGGTPRTAVTTSSRTATSESSVRSQGSARSIRRGAPAYMWVDIFAVYQSHASADGVDAEEASLRLGTATLPHSIPSPLHSHCSPSPSAPLPIKCSPHTVPHCYLTPRPFPHHRPRSSSSSGTCWTVLCRAQAQSSCTSPRCWAVGPHRIILLYSRRTTRLCRP